MSPEESKVRLLQTHAAIMNRALVVNMKMGAALDVFRIAEEEKYAVDACMIDCAIMACQENLITQIFLLEEVVAKALQDAQENFPEAFAISAQRLANQTAQCTVSQAPI